jgi:chorismate-pyruvate lyase
MTELNTHRWAKNLLTPAMAHCLGGRIVAAGSTTPILANASTGSIIARGLGSTRGDAERVGRAPTRERAWEREVELAGSGEPNVTDRAAVARKCGVEGEAGGAATA